ncbi:hypothetical protein MRB53_039814 [Persea americana]|nr:hypothetical protein MRB53_039814 [Persea americana]
MSIVALIVVRLLEIAELKENISHMQDVRQDIFSLEHQSNRVADTDQFAADEDAMTPNRRRRPSSGEAVSVEQSPRGHSGESIANGGVVICFRRASQKVLPEDKRVRCESLMLVTFASLVVSARMSVMAMGSRGTSATTPASTEVLKVLCRSRKSCKCRLQDQDRSHHPLDLAQRSQARPREERTTCDSESKIDTTEVPCSVLAIPCWYVLRWVVHCSLAFELVDQATQLVCDIVLVSGFVCYRSGYGWAPGSFDAREGIYQTGFRAHCADGARTWLARVVAHEVQEMRMKRFGESKKRPRG